MATDKRTYEVRLDGEDSTIITEAALMAAWRSNVPDLALIVRFLRIGESRLIFTDPRVEVVRKS